MSKISSIDDLLMGVGNSQQPATPEHKEMEDEEKAPIEELEKDSEDEKHEVSYDDDDADSDESQDEDDDESSDDERKPEKPDTSDDDVDEYGNQKERLSKSMKERLDRKDKQYQREIEQRDRELQNLRQQLQQQGASKEVQQAVKDFKYNPDEEVGWEQQLSEFVKQTVSNLQTEQQQQQRKVREEQAHREFAQKFTKGMERFGDFREVTGSMPMDDAMTLALRGMADPAAFIYAASKRNPQEIERISKLPDPYARMVEMGKLEERMRKSKPVTKTPRPLGRTKEDSSVKVKPKEKDTSGDDLLAKADQKRLATVRSRHARNR